MTEEETRVIRIVVEGRVQGVGYRTFLVREALRLSLAGWARNRFDGSVEAVAAGPRIAIDEFVEAARRGPRLARVDALRGEEADAAALREGGGGAGFAVAPTA